MVRTWKSGDAGGWRWVFAASASAGAAMLEISVPGMGSLVSVHLLAALLGIGLDARSYRRLIALIAVALLAPMFLSLGEIAPPRVVVVGEAIERLAGLICLGGLSWFAGHDRTQSVDLAHGAARTVHANDETAWLQELISHELGSRDFDLLALGSDSGFERWENETRDVPERIEEGSTDVHSGDDVPPFSTPEISTPEISMLADSDRELSFDQGQGHDLNRSGREPEKLLERLRVSGRFSDRQLELLREELANSYGAVMALSGGRMLEAGVRVGRFVVDEPLGRGGEGNVYRAHDAGGDAVAIKILHNMRVGDRFRREMHLVRQLAHPNIVTAYEVGEFRGLPFITMELLRGPDLNVLVRQRGPLDWRESARYVLQAAHALAHAHRRELIHRDVKPGNLILNGDGMVKLVDLGLASMQGDVADLESVVHDKTREGHLAGTLPYMAPEQAHSLSDATVQSDIYGLGATWFYLLTGKERLLGHGFAKQYQNLLIWRRFRSLPARVMPVPLRRVYHRMVAYRARDRYADCEDLATELEAALIAAGESAVVIEGVHALVVEDSQTDMVLTLEMLRRSNSTLTIHEARTLADGLGICQEQGVDLVLLDLSLPDSSGVETVIRFRETFSDVPLVVLTGMKQEDVGAQCLRAGANAFISKSSLTPHRMERIIFVTLSRCGISRQSPRTGTDG